MTDVICVKTNQTVQRREGEREGRRAGGREESRINRSPNFLPRQGFEQVLFCACWLSQEE